MNLYDNQELDLTWIPKEIILSSSQNQNKTANDPVANKNHMAHTQK